MLLAACPGKLGRFPLQSDPIRVGSTSLKSPTAEGLEGPVYIVQNELSITEWGAAGVGQSSWGPAVYGLVPGEVAARELAARAAGLLGSAGRVFEGGFAASGARVWRSELASLP